MKKVSLAQAFWRLCGAGALLTAVGLTSLQSPDARAADAFGRRNSASRTAAAKFAADNDEDDILQVLEEEMAPDAGIAPPETPYTPFMADEKEKAPEEPPAPWTLTELFNNSDGSNPFKDSGVKISGHTQYGYVNNPDGAFTGNGNTLSQQQWGVFGLQQQYLFMEKVADGAKGWGWGFRVDGLYGLQGFDGQSFGNVNTGHWDYLNGFDHGAYNFALPQMYGELAYDKLSVKMGHFYTIVGYEVVPSTQQFFITRQLTFWNSEPFTHTGALGTYKASDKLQVLGGWVAGMDTGFYQFNGGSSFLGGFNWNVSDKLNIVYSMIWGNLGWRGNGAINSIIASYKWTDKFSTVTQFDDLATDLNQLDPTSPPNAQTFTNIPQNYNVQGGVPRQSIGLIQYGFYDITSQVKAGVRGEWYRPDDVNYYTLSFGLNYKPTANLMFRPEVRQMWGDNHQIYSGAGFTGNIYNQTVWAIDAIISY